MYLLQFTNLVWMATTKYNLYMCVPSCLFYCFLSLSLPPSLPLCLFLPSPQAQYVFIHDALEELITCGDTAIMSHNLRLKIGNLGKVDPNKFITGFQDQFEVCVYKYMYKCKHCEAYSSVWVVIF